MRKALLAVTIALVICLQLARADAGPSAAAPADEYFGPYQQSVLEIRNRLNDYDRLDPRGMLDPSVAGYLDHLQLAIRDWQHKYPRDPWLPGTFAHLIREYWRAGQVSSETGAAAVAFMRAAYPDAAETAETVSLVYGSNQTLDEIARDGSEAPPSYPASPSYAATPSYAPIPSYAATPSYAPIPSYAEMPSYAEPASYAAAPSYGAPVDEAPANDLAASDQVAPSDPGPTNDATPEDDAPTPPPGL
jgi:hypothetical protein